MCNLCVYELYLNKLFKTPVVDQALWSMLIILMCEAEMGRSQLEARLGKTVNKTLSQKTSWVWWFTFVIPARRIMV
jgi:hypothetical protein